MNNLWYLIRHGETDWSLVEKYSLPLALNNYVPLTDKGKKQIESSSSYKALKTASIIISSPFTRALESACVLSKHLNIPLKVEYLLHERILDKNFGNYSPREIIGLCDEYSEAVSRGELERNHPWESFSEIRDRVLPVFSRYSVPVGIAVCHEYVIKSITGLPEIPLGGIVETRFLGSHFQFPRLVYP